MSSYNKLVRKARIEYNQIEDYVMEKACGLMKLDLTLYKYAFTRALQQPSMVSKIRASDDSFRRRMWQRIESQKKRVEAMSDDEKKKIYFDLLEL